MPSNFARLLSKANLSLVLLWLGSVIFAVLGYLLMTSSNADQATVYTSGEADYATLFAGQSGSTVGGMLIAVGVLGVLLALAVQAVRQPQLASPQPMLIATDEADVDPVAPITEATSEREPARL